MLILTIPKRLLSLVVLCTLSLTVYGGHERGIESMRGSGLFSAASATNSNTNGLITNPETAPFVEIMDHSYQTVRFLPNWSDYLDLQKVTNDVVLRLDDLQAQSFSSDWSLEIEYTIYYNADELDFTNPFPSDYETGTLSIYYTTSGEYIDQSRRVHTSFNGNAIAHQGLNPRLYIRSTNFIGNTVDQNLLNTADIDLFLDLELHTEKCYVLQDNDLKDQLTDASNYTFSNPIDYDYAEVTWAYVEGAEYYELEWLFVDLGLPIDESLSIAASSITDYPNFDYDFADAFTVSLQENSFKIPLNFPTGILLYRLRAVGYDKCVTKVYGQWSKSLNQGNIHNLQSTDYIELNGFELDKTWQSSSTFIEGGKHVDAITFFDGTLRSRQSIAVNKEANISVINTPVFDYSGRQSLSIAPFALENNSLKFNTNISEYPRSAFDAPTTISTPLDYTTASGEESASKYYSSANDFDHSHKAYIPNADDQPFSRTLFKNDGTNRIQEQSGMGPNFQIGSNQTTKYYYLKPSQYELDRLLGNDAGYAKYYSKVVIVDGNGQGTYQILDANSKVVISGLYGDNPSNLDPVPTLADAEPESVTLDISNQNYTNQNGTSLNYTFDIASQVSPSDLYFSYNLSYMTTPGISFQSSLYPDFNTTPSIYNLNRLFDLNLELINTSTQASIVIINQTGIDLSSGYANASFSSSTTFDPGSYVFQKTLSLQDDVTEVVNTFETDQTFIELSDFTPAYEACGCSESCIENFLNPHFGIIPEDQFSTYYPNISPTNDAYSFTQGTMLYYIVYLNDNSLLLEGDIDFFSPFVDQDLNPSDDQDLFIENIEHCHYTCDLPSVTIYEGYSPLVNQVTPGSGEFWNLPNPAPSPTAFWEDGPGTPAIFDLVDQQDNPISFSLSGNQQSQLTDFSTNKWLDDDYWENFEDQLFKVDNPYSLSPTPEELVLPLTRDYFLKYVLLPAHPEFNLLKGLYTEEYIRFNEHLAEQTIFTPYADPSWVPNSPSYFTHYSTVDPLSFVTSTSISLPPYPDPSQIITVPTSIYDIDEVLEHFLGASNPSVYDFIENNATASFPSNLIDRFHGTTGQIGLFDAYVSKESFFERLYRDLRTTKHFATYFSDNISNPLILESDELVPGHTYSDLGLQPQVDAAYLWSNIHVDLITMGATGDLSDYLNTVYPTNFDQVDLFKATLKQWFEDNIFIQTQADAAAQLVEDPDNGLNSALADYIQHVSTVNALVQQTYQTKLFGDFQYFDQLNITQNTDGTFTITSSLTSLNIQNFSLDNAEASLFGTSFLFEDFKAYINDLDLVDEVLSNEDMFPDAGVALHTACSNYVTSNNIEALLSECTSGLSDPILIDNIVDEFKTTLLNNEVFLYHFYNNTLDYPFVNPANASCTFITYYESYNTFELPESASECARTNLKIMALEYVSGVTDINDLTPGHFTTPVIESILIDLGFEEPIPSSVITTFYDNLIDPTTTGSCFHPDGPSLSTLSSIADYHIYDLLCAPYIEEDLGSLPASCDPLTATDLEQLQLSMYNQALTNLSAEFSTWYEANKLTGIDEDISYTFPQLQYQQTLYFYDQADNLVKTVAPKGVKPLLDADILQVSFNRSGLNNANFISPDHTATYYVYNTLNQLVSKSLPENYGYYTNFHYDPTGRLIASQSPEQYSQTAIVNVHPMANQNQEERFSYTLYDDLGRVTESGVAIGTYSGSSTSATAYTNYLAFEAFVLQLERREVTRTYYDDEFVPSAVVNPPSIAIDQKFLRNRVSWVEYFPILNLNPDDLINDDKYYEHAFSRQFYSYDVHGNVNHFYVQHQVSEVSSITKHMTYTYDLISGNVIEFAYQPKLVETEFVDQFYHRYYYDESNRLVEAETSKDRVIWETEAKYFYYPHGPLARVELGDKQVQGTDYAYTLHGWLKSINGVANDRQTDMSQDGLTGLANEMNRNAHFAQDELSFKIDYYDGDYSPITPNTNLSSFGGANGLGLYNGNIAAIAYDISDLSPVNYRYRYDQLQRLTEMKSYSNTDQFTGYKTALTYDPNGNIESLERRRGTTTGSSSILMDNINYTYESIYDDMYNQLNSAVDLVDEPGTSDDYVSNLVNSSSETYYYDKDGNEIYKYRWKRPEVNDPPIYDGHRSNRWFSSGKVKSTSHVFSDGGGNDNKPWRLNFFYDATGNRIAKVLKTADDQSLPIANPTNLSLSVIQEGAFEDAFEYEHNYDYTYYINDPTGNTIATYSHKFDAQGTNYTLKERVKHFNIYGSSRLGTAERPIETKAWAITSNGGPIVSTDTKLFIGGNLILDESGPAEPITNLKTRTLGSKRYELTNHLSNVLATISDRKSITAPSSGDQHYISDTKSYSDYYPFGMQMPGRKFNGGSHRYGFNGMEKDDEVNGEGNSYTTLFRQYDSRIARWKSTDPKKEKYPFISPYASNLNNPLRIIDINGDTIRIVGGSDFIHTTNAMLQKLRATDIGRKVIDYLQNHPEDFEISEALYIKGTQYDPDNNELSYDPNPWISKVEGGDYDGFLGLSHEVYHAYQDANNRMNLPAGQLEVEAAKFGNYIRNVYGYKNLRESYGPYKVTDNIKTTEKVTDFEFKPIIYYEGGLLGSESSDNTKVYVSPQGGHQVNYTKTKAGKTEEVTEDVSKF